MADEQLTIDSPEVREALRRRDHGKIRQWIEEGRYRPHPGNPYVRTVAPVEPPTEGQPAPEKPKGEPDQPAELLNFHSPEVQRMLKKGDRAGVEKLIREGRYEPLPGNPYAVRSGDD